ncbi:MAG: phosphoribosylaminoimidazolesuccinocarboxamide synthase [Phycisphaerae bacterium]
MSTGKAVTQTNIPNLPLRRGKVRDVYDWGEEILLVATDRISAFDVIMPTPIPGKGELLTAISAFWFNFFADHTANHLIEVVEATAPHGLDDHLTELRGRTMRCRKTTVVPIECVVRGYLAGSGWVDYQRDGSVCGIALPPGLRQSDRLPEPIFTPATKADVGHDENISFEQACKIAGEDVINTLRERSIKLYMAAAEYAAARGIIIADTKFEWGRRNDEIILIDEVLTPDSSRFWPADRYEVGRSQPSFDKQFVRDYLLTLVEQGKWDKTPPGPELPEPIVVQTLERYREAVSRLTKS